MNGLHRDVLQGIGNTPLLALRNIVPDSVSCHLSLLMAFQRTANAIKFWLFSLLYNTRNLG